MKTATVTRIPAPSSAKILSRQSKTRERILLESARQFLDRGFESVSVEHIVAAAEIARSSFYRFFANREEVLASIIRPVFEEGIALMRERWRPDGESTADQLIHLADDALYMAKHQGRNCVAVLTPPGMEAAAQPK